MKFVRAMIWDRATLGFLYRSKIKKVILTNTHYNIEVKRHEKRMQWNEFWWTKRKSKIGSRIQLNVKSREREKRVFVPKTRLRTNGLSGRFKMAKRLRCEALAKTTYEPEDKREREKKKGRRRSKRRPEWKKRVRLNGKGGGVARACCARGWKFLSYFQQSLHPSFSSSPVFYSRNWKDQRLREVDTVPRGAILLSLAQGGAEGGWCAFSHHSSKNATDRETSRTIPCRCWRRIINLRFVHVYQRVIERNIVNMTVKIRVKKSFICVHIW